MAAAAVGMGLGDPASKEQGKPALGAGVRRQNLIRDEVGGVFRVLVGVHFDDGPPGCDCDYCFKSEGKNHRYRARRMMRVREGNTFFDPDPEGYTGDLVTTLLDLEKRHNQGSFSRKFERVIQAAVPPPAPPAPHWQPSDSLLEAMSFKDVQDYAAAEEIDLRGATSKAEALKVVKANR